jgi:glycosyltransferase involved in cell wall biosynthesis
MDNLALVSIILPTYNRGKIINSCIDSVLNQTYDKFELIVTDDCSTDETRLVVTELAKSDNRIKYFKNEKRMGLPGNRNSGLSKARGKYVFFIEDDIIVEPKCVEFLVGAINKISAKGEMVGGITPAVINLRNNNNKNSDGILSESFRKTNRHLEKPCIISRFTGIHYYNFDPGFKGLQRVPDMSARSMYPKDALISVSGYDAKTYKGNFLYEETDLNTRISKKDYVFYFDPTAILYHKEDLSGGCGANPSRYAYYYLLNHTKFIIKNYGVHSLYMMPCFAVAMVFIGGKSIVLNLKKLISRGNSENFSNRSLQK